MTSVWLRGLRSALKYAPRSPPILMIGCYSRWASVLQLAFRAADATWCTKEGQFFRRWAAVGCLHPRDDVRKAVDESAVKRSGITRPTEFVSWACKCGASPRCSKRACGSACTTWTVVTPMQSSEAHHTPAYLIVMTLKDNAHFEYDRWDKTPASHVHCR